MKTLFTFRQTSILLIDSPDTNPVGSPEETALLPAIQSDDDRAEARRYSGLSLRADLAEMAVDFVFLAVFAFVLAVPLDGLLKETFVWLEIDWIRFLVLYLVLYVSHLAITLPFSYYSGFLLEHQFDLSNLSFGGWLKRYALNHAIGFPTNALVLLLVYLAIWNLGFWWILAAAGGAFLFAVVLGRLFPSVILPLFYELKPLEDKALAAQLEAVLADTGLEMEGVYTQQLSAETKKVNAALVGVGRSRRVLLGDTLLEQFSPEEIKVILAHEAGHFVKHHLHKLMFVGVTGSVLAFVAFDLCLRGYVTAMGQEFSYAAVPVFSLPLFVLLGDVFTTLSGPALNALMRRFERQCDWYALEKTNNADAYRSAFQKLALINKADPDPHPLEVMLFEDHPPIKERLAMADEFLAMKSGSWADGTDSPSP